MIAANTAKNISTSDVNESLTSDDKLSTTNKTKNDQLKISNATESSVSQKPYKANFALASFIMSFLGILLTPIPYLSLVIQGVGITLGIAGYNSIRKRFAIAGIVICCFGLLISIPSLIRNISESFSAVNPERNDASVAQPAQVSNEHYDPIDPLILAKLDVGYYIDYENGVMPIGELPIGTRIADPSWEWEYRLGDNYSNNDTDGNPVSQGEVKPVVWIVVANNHYGATISHVTLLAEEIVGKHCFDDKIDSPIAGSGFDHWGDSRLRSWLNSVDIHDGEGFYQSFSPALKKHIVSTEVPNKEWENGSAYKTRDNVFIPTLCEFGITDLSYTYKIGEVFSYFHNVGNDRRKASLEQSNVPYWTRSPSNTFFGCYVIHIDDSGYIGQTTWAPSYEGMGVRPALNIKADTLVTAFVD